MTRLLISLEGLRHPPHLGASGEQIYRAAIDISKWADERGFDRVSIGEHHQSLDGYIPAPLLLASAIGGATSRIQVRCSLLLAALYDPIRLAEEIAVADLCLGGRLEVGLGVGYVKADFDMFGVDYHTRGDALDSLIPLLRLAWTGEPFEHRGRTVVVRPRPVQDPFPINVGGESRRGITRALTLADGYFPPAEYAWARYRALAVELGHADPGPYRRGPSFIWVTTEPKDEVWKRLVPHIRHQIESYAAWSPTGRPVGPFQTFDYAKPGGTYQVLTPDEAVELADDLGTGGEFVLAPLLGGIAPAEAWTMLETFAHRVLPLVTRG
jgi:alkanesulfonate monooxygenase SsuD/methylene tetrahydromethanopterin reductase-like flavin-dependent oxidoreductase (luciferase family)